MKRCEICNTTYPDDAAHIHNKRSVIEFIQKDIGKRLESFTRTDRVQTALPRPTAEQHTRPLRLFAWSDYDKPVTAADVAEGAKLVDKLRGSQPHRNRPTGYVTGEDTPEANERFWEAAREQLGDEPIEQSCDHSSILDSDPPICALCGVVLNDEPIDEENPLMKCSRCGLMKHSVHTCMVKIEVTSPHSYDRAMDVKRKP